jgi:hypothetical protein
VSDLKKAVTQVNLTADTVDDQYCSDWLKGEIRKLFAALHACERHMKLAREHCKSDEIITAMDTLSRGIAELRNALPGTSIEQGGRADE